MMIDDDDDDANTLKLLNKLFLEISVLCTYVPCCVLYDCSSFVCPELVT